jgi:excisionase family DNA binding protein
LTERDRELTEAMFGMLADQLAERLAPRVADLIGGPISASSPWLTTAEAIDYTRLPEGTFRKLAASGRIPSHGGKTKLFYRPELDQALLASRGLEEEARELRRTA